jgi:peptidyl-tRNA hydrolase, PTH1 family
MTDYVITGQGNPGPRYAATRHNLGFWCIDALARRHQINVKAGLLVKRDGETGKGRIAGAEVLLLKPRTFYNASGRAVARHLGRERVPARNLIVIYDDLDLEEGRIRLRPQGSHGGNNGLKSIIDSTGTTDFGRIRVGVGRPTENGKPSWDTEVVVPWLLSAPPKDARAALDSAVERVCDAVETIIRDGWERAMDTYNRANGPGKPQALSRRYTGGEASPPAPAGPKGWSNEGPPMA